MLIRQVPFQAGGSQSALQPLAEAGQPLQRPSVNVTGPHVGQGFKLPNILYRLH